VVAATGGFADAGGFASTDDCAGAAAGAGCGLALAASGSLSALRQDSGYFSCASASSLLLSPAMNAWGFY